MFETHPKCFYLQFFSLLSTEENSHVCDSIIGPCVRLTEKKKKTLFMIFCLLAESSKYIVIATMTFRISVILAFFFFFGYSCSVMT